MSHLSGDVEVLAREMPDAEEDGGKRDAGEYVRVVALARMQRHVTVRRRPVGEGRARAEHLCSRSTVGTVTSQDKMSKRRGPA